MEEPLSFITTASTSWYNPSITLETIPKPAYALLEKYTGLAGQDLVDHVNDTRNRAWTSSPYPCVGLFIFLDLNMSIHPIYPEILSRLTSTSSSSRILDLGCGLGQDERKLVFDGVEPEKIVGVDISQGLINAGYELFMDRGSKKEDRITFVKGDILVEDPLKWADGNLAEGVEIVHVGAIFHLFEWEQQVVLAFKLATLTSRKEDAVIFGYQFSSPTPGVQMLGPKKEAKVFGHDRESWTKLWEEVGEATGTKWRIEILEVMPDKGLVTKGNWGFVNGKLMRFSVHKV